MAVPQFPGQRPDEQVKLLVRPHWLVLLRPLAAVLFLAILPIAVLVVLSANQVEAFSGIGLAVTAVTVPAYYLTLVTWLFIAWVDYYLDVGIVTDHRIIDIDQRGLFRRNVAELECRMVQDINADKTGVLQTIFNFGDVVVQTAGERPNFTFHAIPKPEAMVDRIRDVMSASHSQDEGAAEKIKEAVSKVEEAADKMTGSEATPPAGKPAQPSSGQPAAAPSSVNPPTDEALSSNPAAPSPPAQPVKPEEPAQDIPRQYER